MAKIVKKGLWPPDDPIFSGGVQTFNVRKAPTPEAEEALRKLVKNQPPIAPDKTRKK